MRPPMPPARVLEFVREHLRDIEELQLMLAMVQAPDRWWDAPSAANELGFTRAVAARALDRLATLNLLDIRITGDVRYRFQPGTDELADIVRGCQEAFRTNPIALFTAVEGRPRRGLRDFADAFRLRKK